MDLFTSLPNEDTTIWQFYSSDGAYYLLYEELLKSATGPQFSLIDCDHAFNDR